jgi:prolyl oligopeptidase
MVARYTATRSQAFADGDFEYASAPMKPTFVAAVCLAAACAAPQKNSPAAAGATAAHIEVKPPMPYPPTRADEIQETLFGAVVADPYRWLEDAGRDDVKAWMAAQDQLTRAHLGKLPGRDRLAKRFRELLYVDSISAPLRRGTRYFYTRTHADKEKAIVYWREGADGEEHVLLDPNTMSQDGTVSLGTWVPSYDGKRVAYALKANNSDEATLHLIDVASGKESPIDVIEGAKYAQPSWTPSGDGYFYTWLPPVGGAVTVAERPGHAEIRFHKIGADPKTDARVHDKTGNPQTFLSVEGSRDGHWLFVYVSHGWNSTDIYYRDQRVKDPTWQPFAVGLPSQFEVTAWRDRFYVRTNDGAPRWRVYVADPKRPARADWKEIVPQSDAVLDGVQIVGEHLALTYLRNAASELEVRTLDGTPVRKVALPGIGTTGGMVGNPADDEAYFTFMSFTVPHEVYRTSVKSGATTLWAEVKVPIDPAPYTVEQVWYPSKDGTQISMFIVRRKDMPKDGSTPFLLGGYGGFNVSLTPMFYGGRYPWLEAGGGFAIPNLRGGGEYGEDWHKAGMLERKQNVFDDFIAAAQFLIDAGYTRPDRLAIRGGSNGGLLMGAAVTQRPDLFRAVLCEVPLLDMVRYHKFGSGKTWVPEYGSADDEAGFKTLFAYSPYHHVKHAAYPSLLMMSADSDDRVDPMHARKMTAALQAQSTGAHPILLRIERHAGHGGADLVKQLVEQATDSYAFLMSELGMTPR